MRTLTLFILFVVTAAFARHYLEHPELWPKAPEAAAPRRTLAYVDPAPTATAKQTAALAAESVAIAASVAPIELNEFGFERACRAPPTAPVRAKPATTIHRWVDAEGRVHFGDRAPRASGATVYDPGIRANTEYFSLNIQYDGLGTVPFLKDRLRAEVTRIYEHLADLLGHNRLRQVALNIRIFETHDAYLSYATELSPRLATTGGFYSLERNEAATWQHADHADTLAIVRHEAMHVIASGLLGGVPIWLNEGLAEYFEALEMNGTQARVPMQVDWLALARKAIASGYPGDLRAYFDLAANDWYALAYQPVHYALGWSLVFFLLDSDAGQNALISYLGELADHYCAPVDQISWFEHSYPGGITALMTDYQRWLRHPGGQPHVF